MLYTLELGPIEQGIIGQAVRTGQPLPDRIAQAPTLRLGLGFYLQAFFDLDSERTHSSNGLSRIPWHAIQFYATHFNLNDEQRFRLGHFIRAMDAAHLTRLADELKHG